MSSSHVVPPSGIYVGISEYVEKMNPYRKLVQVYYWLHRARFHMHIIVVLLLLLLKIMFLLLLLLFFLEK